LEITFAEDNSELQNAILSSMASLFVSIH
jgi:hypothetical protein